MLDCWGRGFESRLGDRFSSVVCCVGSGFRDEMMPRSEESYRCVCVCFMGGSRVCV